MLSYVPYIFDLYGTLKPHLHLTMLHVVGFAGFTGKCTASSRTLASRTGKGKSTVARHLTELVCAGVLTRHRKPGGCYSYTVDPRFLPPAAELSRDRVPVSHPRKPAVPPARTNKKTFTQKEKPRADSHVGVTDADRERWKWNSRIQQWHNSGGTHWPSQWGPKPTDPGFTAPVEMI